MSDAMKRSRRVTAYRRYRKPDDPVFVAALTEHKTETLAEQIQAVVNEAPPLTAEQRDRLAALLRPVPDDAA